MAGNRTPVSRVAGEICTTEPPMPLFEDEHKYTLHFATIKHLNSLAIKLFELIEIMRKLVMKLSGNRTLISRVAGGSSTFEPQTLTLDNDHKYT